jgi:hypothetical protein
VECGDIILNLLSLAKTRILDIDAFGCLTELIGAIQFGKNSIVTKQYSGVCDYEPRKVLRLITEVTRIYVTNKPKDDRAQKFATEIIDEMQARNFRPSACDQFSHADKSPTIAALKSLLK